MARVEGRGTRVSTTQAGASGQSDALETVHAFVRAWERNDADEILALFSDDARWYDGYPAGLYEGREAIAAQIARYARHISNVQIDVLHEAVDGDVVFQERVDRGERNGRPFAVAAVCLFRVRDGKIVENRDYWNPAAYRGSA
jgi:limonene-1,2-epoxide hydrolase